MQAGPSNFGLVGHQTEEQRRRYRHLNPSTKENAITKVFGAGSNGEAQGRPAINQDTEAMSREEVV
jgi:hypothetical protein